MTDTAVLEKTKITIDLGHNWNVVFHNDDKTSMQFVISALIEVFNKSLPEAYQLTMKVHNEGSAAVASYSCYDIAEEKAQQTMTLARAFGFPLKVTVEK